MRQDWQSFWATPVYSGKTGWKTVVALFGKDSSRQETTCIILIPVRWVRSVSCIIKKIEKLSIADAEHMFVCVFLQ